MILLWNSADTKVTCDVIDGDVVSQYEWQADRTLARDMLSYLRDRLAEHNATFHDISGIGVFRGPGSFTGLRIGMTVLNTIASSLGAPIVSANGEGWKEECLAKLKHGENETIILPEYGSGARITAPRK